MSLRYKDGIWFAEQTARLSYPDEGNQSYFTVEDSSFWFLYRNKVICDALRKFKKAGPTNETFLDVGGGNGFIARDVQKMGFSTSLLEPGNGVFNARIRGVENIYCCLLSDLPAEQIYDYVGLFDVIEHLEDPVLLLKQVATHMHTDSKLYITVPCYNFLWSSEDVYAGHFKRYTLRKLKHEIEQAGLKPIYYSFFFAFLIAPIFLLRVIPYHVRKILKQNRKTNVDFTKDHTSGGGTKYIVKILLSLEDFFRGLFGRLGFGTSLIVIARKM